MAQVIWTEPALRDVRDIAAFIGKDSAAYAEKIAMRLMRATRRLEQNPLIGWRVPEFDLENIREIYFRPYRIIYTVRDDTCYVVAVVHGRRDLTGLLSPEDIEESTS
jgi:toxin ParE1/3/4